MIRDYFTLRFYDDGSIEAVPVEEPLSVQTVRTKFDDVFEVEWESCPYILDVIKSDKDKLQ